MSTSTRPIRSSPLAAQVLSNDDIPRRHRSLPPTTPISPPTRTRKRNTFTFSPPPLVLPSDNVPTLPKNSHPPSIPANPRALSRNPTENWLSTNTYAITPRFTRLSLASPHIVLPVSVKEYNRRIARANSRASTISARSVSQCTTTTTLPHVSPTDDDHGDHRSPSSPTPGPTPSSSISGGSKSLASLSNSSGSSRNRNPSPSASSFTDSPPITPSSGVTSVGGNSLTNITEYEVCGNPTKNPIGCAGSPPEWVLEECGSPGGAADRIRARDPRRTKSLGGVLYGPDWRFRNLLFPPVSSSTRTTTPPPPSPSPSPSTTGVLKKSRTTTTTTPVVVEDPKTEGAAVMRVAISLGPVTLSSHSTPSRTPSPQAATSLPSSSSRKAQKWASQKGKKNVVRKKKKIKKSTRTGNVLKRVLRWIFVFGKDFKK